MYNVTHRFTVAESNLPTVESLTYGTVFYLPDYPKQTYWRIQDAAVRLTDKSGKVALDCSGPYKFSRFRTDTVNSGYDNQSFADQKAIVIGLLDIAVNIS